MQFLEDYIKKWPDFLTSLNVFSESERNHILRNLKSAKTDSNFSSTLTEVFFGQFFIKNSANNIFYDKSIFLEGTEYKPDWVFTLNDQKFIAEVIRINPKDYDSEPQILTWSIINIDKRKINGDSSRFLDKFNKYEKVVNATDSQYLVCCYIHYETGIDKDDLSELLYGSQVHQLGNAINYSRMSGLYYTALKDSKVIGVLLKTQDAYLFYPNYPQLEGLNKRNKKTFLTYDINKY